MKLKKLFLISSVIFTIAIFCGITANAETEGIYTYRVLGNDTYITDCDTSVSGDITIPSTLGGHTVTVIDTEAFSSCSNITSITIPDGIKSIGYYAFLSCSSLTSITIPDSVTQIKPYAFYGSALYQDESNWENGVLYIGNHLIKARNIHTGTDYVIRPGTKTIASNAFEGCDGLTSVTIPNGVTSIWNNTFYHCDNLKSVTIPDSVQYIGNEAFDQCQSLISITIPDGVTRIPQYTFRMCTSLTNITIPNSITSISNEAFYECSNLANVYYKGTREEWNSITIYDNNTSLTSANIHYATDYEILGISSPKCDIEKDADGNITKILLPNSLSSVTLDLSVSDGATWKMYRTDSYTTENTNKTINNLIAGNTSRKAYIRVTSAVGTTKDYAITVYRKTKATDPVITINGSKVTITAESGDIYYTTDGSEPTASSTKYTGAFKGLSNAVIKAIVIDSSKDEWSNIVTDTIPTYITTTIETDYVTSDSSTNTVYFGFIISSDGEPTGTYIVAVYNDKNKMIGCKTININTATDYIEDSFTYSGTPHTYKAFFWNNLENLVPLCNNVEGTVIK